jgi:peptide/nickel transport system permease protein
MTDIPTTVEPLAAAPGRFAGLWRKLIQTNFGVQLAIGFLLLVVLAAVFAPLLAPHDPTTQSLLARLSRPFTTGKDGTFYLLGSDTLGRDLASLMLYGARVSVTVGLATVALSGTIGITLGLIAGYFGRTTDAIIMRIVDLMLAFPSLLLALLFVFTVGGGFTTVIFALALTRWMVFARVSRGIALSVRQEPYIAAATALGCSHPRIMLVHMLPSVLPQLLVLATLEVSVAILAEASLSFLGLGVQPPGTSWGLLIAEGRPYIRNAWWVVTFPGVLILLTSLSLNWIAAVGRAK